MQPTDAAAGAVGIMFILMIALYLFICLFGVIVFVFWIWMIIDVVTKEPPGNDKVMWVLIVILLNWIGALIYYFLRKRKRTKAGLVAPVNPSPPTHG